MVNVTGGHPIPRERWNRIPYAEWRLPATHSRTTAECS